MNDFIDYTGTVYPFTQRQLEKFFTPEVLSKHGRELAFLYQNGYEMTERSNEAIEQSLDLLHGLKTREDFAELQSSCGGVEVDGEIGDKIIADALYAFVQGTKWAVYEIPIALVKNALEVHHDEINSYIDLVQGLLTSRDLAISVSLEAFKKENISVVEALQENITKYEKFSDDDKRVLSYNTFLTIRENVFAMYLLYNKRLSEKKDVMGVSKAGNVNDEIYGSAGGYNPIAGTVKAVNGSAVYELWLVSQLDLLKPACIARLNLIVKEIIDDTGCYKDVESQSFDDEKSKESFIYLSNYLKHQTVDVEKVRRIVQNIDINGIVSLLCLKHQFSLLDEKKNAKREEAIIKELEDIAKYCNVQLK